MPTALLPNPEKQRILIVDDKPSDTLPVKLCREQANADIVREEKSATRALGTAEKFQTHLILPDVRIPERNGGDVAASFRAGVADPTADKVSVSPSPLYRPELDILRFVAFLGVFVSHFLDYSVSELVDRGIPGALAKVFVAMVHGGGFGVDLFFVLSAYLITNLLLREKERFGRLDIKAFYIRRILRIWPLYYGFTAVVLLFPLLDPGSNFAAHYILPFLFFSGNWGFVVWGWPISVLTPLWSVSVEEQFYLLWPPIVARLSRMQIVTAACLMALLANLVRAYEVGIVHSSFNKMWGNTFAHLDSLAAGIAFAALLNGRIPERKNIMRIAMATLGVVLLAFVGHKIIADEVPQEIGAVVNYNMVVIGCSLIFFAFLGLDFRSRFLTYLGKISFGLYVYHLLAGVITDKIFEGSGLAYAIVRVCLVFLITVIISAFSYAIWEKPFLNLKRRFTFVESRPN